MESVSKKKRGREISECKKKETDAKCFARWAERKLAALTQACERTNPNPWDDEADSMLSCTFIQPYDHCHSMPQVAQAFYQDGSRACTHVVRYENFEADIAILSQAYEWPLDECLRSKPPQNVKVPSGERLTAEQIPATIRRRIESAYAADFVAFNFCTL